MSCVLSYLGEDDEKMQWLFNCDIFKVVTFVFKACKRRHYVLFV